LSPIGNACGGKIDGILGVDLLDKMGVTIDLKRRIASFNSVPASPAAAYKQMEEHMHHCTSAFEAGNAEELAAVSIPTLSFLHCNVSTVAAKK